MEKFIRHVVAEMDESLIQRCVICGKVICDYNNVMAPEGQHNVSGWPAGNVYVRGGITIHGSAQMIDEEFEQCKK